jgi:O-antigen/teichoic acid export membrane protein
VNLARALLSSALIYATTTGIAAGLPLLLMPLLTRAMTPAEYGLVGMFSVLVAALGALTGLSVHGAVGMRYFERESLDFPRYVTSCLVILAGSTVTTLVLVVLFSPFIQSATGLPLAMMVVALAMSCAQFLIQVRLSIWQSAKQAWRFGAFRLQQSGLDLGLSLGLVLALGLSWHGRIFGMAAAAIILAGLAVVSLTRTGLLVSRFSRDYVRNALRFGLPLVPHAIGGMLLTMSDRVMISSLIGSAETGIYIVAVQMGMAIGLLTDAMNRALAPWLIEALKQRDKTRDVAIVRLSYLYALLLLVGALFAGRVAPFLTAAIAGPEFQAAAPLIGFIALGYCFGGMYLLVVNYVFFANKTAWLAGITLGIGLVNAGLSYVLLSANGLVGAAQAFALSQFLLFVATWALAQKVHPMPWWRSLRAGRIAR